MNIKELLNTGAAVNLTVSALDLKEFALALIDETRRMEAAREKAERKKDREFSVDEVAALLGVTKSTLWRWEKEGYLVPRVRIGRHPRYLQSQIDEMKSKNAKTSTLRAGQ